MVYHERNMFKKTIVSVRINIPYNLNRKYPPLVTIILFYPRYWILNGSWKKNRRTPLPTSHHGGRMSSTAQSTPINFTPFALPMFYLHGKHEGDPARFVLGEQSAANLKVGQLLS